MKPWGMSNMGMRIIVNGARGKMGRLACQILHEDARFDLVAETSREENLSEAILKNHAAIVLDLTRADCVYENALCILKHNAHPIIGTSGLNKQQIENLKQISADKEIGGLIVPNFSIAAVLMMRFAQETAKWFNHVEIIEAHHTEKYDAPSGTALKTAQYIAKGRQAVLPVTTSHELLPGARGASYEEVSIHSVRLPGVVAKQQVIFGSLGETLTLEHQTIDRASFMPGVLLACDKVTKLDGLYEGLECVMG